MLAAIAVTVSVPCVAYADRAVHGIVVDDATGLPVIGALVAVGGGETATDDDGTFNIAELEHGRLEVVVLAEPVAGLLGIASIC